MMGRISLNVQKEFCAECTLALRRFIGKMDGVESVDVESGRIEIDFDDLKIPASTLMKISKDSIEKLGYRLDE